VAPEIYADTEHAIYEAAVVPELWPEALRRLTAIGDCAGGALLCLNERGIHHVGSDPVMNGLIQRFIDEGWSERNSRGGNVIAKGLMGMPRFVNEYDYLAPGEDLTDPMINELFRPAGLGRAAGFVNQLPHGDIVILNMEQYWERGPIRGDDLARLDSFYPHLARAAMLAGRLDLQRVRTAVETLAAVGLAAVALASDGRVIYANEAFENNAELWTTRMGDRVALNDTIADTKFREALQAINRSTGQRSLALRAGDGGAVAAVLQVVPVRRSAHDIFSRCVAIAVLTSPKADAVNASLVQALFDLTPAELGVAQGIANGRTVVEMAAASGRSVHTVRNQLKNAMEKTGSHRQVDLALLVRRGREQVG
jgi:DNA-binding CsgD family transcriptional regulator